MTNQLCIKCNEFLVFREAGFDDIADLCVHCYYELKLDNFRRELDRSGKEAKAALERAAEGIDRATETIGKLKDELLDTKIAYAEMVGQFSLWIDGQRKTETKAKSK